MKSIGVMDWNNNPRIDLERRIKQLYKRLNFLVKYTGLGSIDYDQNGVASRFYPSRMHGNKVRKARRLIGQVHKELNLKEKQLRSF